MTSPREGAFAAPDGTALRSLLWEPRDGARCTVLIVHGLGDHAARYDELARGLARAGHRVIAYDQRGHGRSPGLRGGGTVEGLVDDLTRVVRGLPGDTTVLLGQSMGALLVLRLLQRGDLPGVAGAILSAPWLRTRIPVPAWKRHLGTLLERLLPRVALPTPSEPGALTRDPDRQAAHRADPLVHHRVTPRLFFSVEAAQERLLREGIADPPPLLFLLPGADRLTDARAAETLASSLPSGRVRVEWLPDVPHEPFQDVERVAALAVVADWLDALPGVEPRGEDRVV